MSEEVPFDAFPGPDPQKIEEPEKCENCRFVHINKSISYSQTNACRRRPPRVIIISGNPESIFPGVHLDGWCGKYKPKK